MKFKKKDGEPNPVSDRSRELDFIYETYSRTGSLDQFKKQFPDSVLNQVFEELKGDVCWSADEILVMCYRLDAVGIDFIKR